MTARGPAATFPRGPRSAWLSTWQSWRDPLGCHDRWAEHYGDPYAVTIFGHRFVLSVEPSTIQAFFQANAGSHGLYLAFATLPTAGRHSLIQAVGRPHREKRGLILPALTGSALAEHTAALGAAAERVLARAAEKPRVCAYAAALEFAIEAILELIGLGASPRRAALALAVQEAHEALRPEYLFLPAWQRSAWAKPLFGRIDRALDRCLTLLREEIDRLARRAALPTTTLLGSLLAARPDGQPIPREAIVDHVRTAIFGGIESSTATMAFMVDFVFRRRRIVERLQREVRAHAWPWRDAAVVPPYVRAVVRETLRFCPVTGLAVHELHEDTHVAGYDLPRGTGVGANVYRLHRRPDFYPRPHEFLPERFLEHKPVPYTFLPFGAGARACIGAQLATLEASLFLAVLVRDFEVHLLHTQPSRVIRRPLVACPADGVPVRLRRLH